MTQRVFRDLLQQRWSQGKFLCVGLDSQYDKIPAHLKTNSITADEPMITFNKAIIEATHDLVCAYKPNIAFYAAAGAAGLHALRVTIGLIHSIAPEVPIILDAKRADIGDTNVGYVVEAFHDFDADAVTVNPYFGQQALQPFLRLADRGIIVLCRTSNPGAGEFQDLPVGTNGEPLYLHVARQVHEKWNKLGNCCLVVGATAPEQMARVRAVTGEMPFLIPGIGKQGGDLAATIANGRNSRGQGMIINSSSGIIFASPGENFATAARDAAVKLHDDILIEIAKTGGMS